MQVLYMEQGSEKLVCRRKMSLLCLNALRGDKDETRRLEMKNVVYEYMGYRVEMKKSFACQLITRCGCNNQALLTATLNKRRCIVPVIRGPASGNT